MPFFESPDRLILGAAPAGDINRDGCPDVFVAHGGRSLHVFLLRNNGSLLGGRPDATLTPSIPPGFVFGAELIHQTEVGHVAVLAPPMAGASESGGYLAHVLASYVAGEVQLVATVVDLAAAWERAPELFEYIQAEVMDFRLAPMTSPDVASWVHNFPAVSFSVGPPVGGRPFPLNISFTGKQRGCHCRAATRLAERAVAGMRGAEAEPDAAAAPTAHPRGDAAVDLAPPAPAAWPAAQRR